MNSLFNKYIFLLFVYICGCQGQLSCKNEDNKDVDWFLILKFPASYNYLYISSDSVTGKWLVPNYAMNDGRNLLAVTMAQLYSSQQNGNFFALYNDERPKQSRISRKSNVGHLKGFVNFDRKAGYWVVHSLPKFPLKTKYEYTDGHMINGQSFLCVSLDVKYLKHIADQLLIMYSDVYDYNFPSNFSSDSDLMDKLYQLVMNNHNEGSQTGIVDLTTLKGVKLTHFGKSHKYFDDLYSGLMGPSLKTSLYVESWMKGPGDKIDTSCQTEYKVYNVQKVSINGMEYSETVDHSKWAVSTSQTQPAVCIGDINRMVSQKKRGGGSLCVFVGSLWNTFLPIVEQYEKCPAYDFIL